MQINKKIRGNIPAVKRNITQAGSSIKSIHSEMTLLLSINLQNLLEKKAYQRTSKKRRVKTGIKIQLQRIYVFLAEIFYSHLFAMLWVVLNFRISK